MNRTAVVALALVSTALALSSGGAAQAAAQSTKPKIWVVGTLKPSSYWPCKGGIVEVDAEAGSKSTDWLVIRITDKAGKKVAGTGEAFEMPDEGDGYIHHKQCVPSSLVKAVASGTRYNVNVYAYKGNKLQAKSTTRLIPYSP